MSQRELRLGFAMGGGVSLGTFCGAALCQSIKLAILRGVGKNQQPYDHVVVDVFSGASAGAMALGLLLRTLIEAPAAIRVQAEARLTAEFGPTGEFDAATPTGWRRDALIRAECAMMMQERAWGKEITIGGLLGREPDGSQREIGHIGSILDRREVDRIARDLLMPPTGAWDPAAARADARGGVLADRVLFACTLANMTPIVSDARSEIAITEAGFIGLADGGTSRTHRELRVFDLHLGDATGIPFAEEDTNPRRWCRYHSGNELPGEIGDLRSPKTWRKIAATVVAAGAFPLAFEPVVLNRSSYEFGPNLWPVACGPAHDTNGTPRKFPFTYVDGGTFNNEPIREAFRLASFIDGQPLDPGVEFDRRIVFVDPFVDPTQPSVRAPVHAKFGTDDGKWIQKSSLDRLVPGHVLSLLSAVMDESRVIEADKVYQVRRDFKERDSLRLVLRGILTAKPSHRPLADLHQYANDVLRSDRLLSMIPPGPLTVPGELDRIRREVAGIVADSPMVGQMGDATTFLSRVNMGTDPAAGEWLYLLACLALDITMDLIGKNDEHCLIAVAPFSFPGDGSAPIAIPLPGSPLEGFSGFCSLVHRPLEFRVARFCAQHFLELCGVIAPGPTPPLNQPDAAGRFELSMHDRRLFDTDCARGLDLLAARVKDMVESSHLLSIGWFTGLALSKIGDMIAKVIRDMAKPQVLPGLAPREYEIRVVVERDGLEIDTSDGNDVPSIPAEPQENAPTWWIGCSLTFDPATGRWSGPGVNVDGIVDHLRVDIDGSIFAGPYAMLELPTDATLLNAAWQTPNPTLVVRLTPRDSDHGDVGGVGAWSFDPGVTALDETL